MPAGQWAGPPVTFQLPQGGYGSISEANLVGYSGMALESDGRRGFVVGLGHRQPLNWPFELRYGREEAKRLGRAASCESIRPVAFLVPPRRPTHARSRHLV